MALQPVIEFSDFKGLDTFDDTIRVSKPNSVAHYLTEAVNVDIDNTGMLRRRDGYTSVYQGTAPHSLFGDSDFCLFVDEKALKTLSKTYGATTLTTLNSNATMRYVKVVNKIYCTNGLDIGYVHMDHRSYTSFSAISKTYKNKMPAGQLIEWFNGRLYVARGSKLYISDPVYPAATDIRKGFIRLNGYITLLQAVDDGIYVADGSQSFLDGDQPEKFVRNNLSDYNAVIGTSVKLDPNFVGSWVDKIFGATPKIGTMAMWLSEKGICIGLNNGQFYNITQPVYNNEEVLYGAALFRIITGVPHYIVVGTQ